MNLEVNLDSESNYNFEVNKYMKRAVGYILSMILFINLIFFIPQSVFGAVDADYHVRIALTPYQGRTSITIKNNSLQIGYFVNGKYNPNSTLNSSDGFTFTPDNDMYYCLNQEYPSYDSVIRAINNMNANGTLIPAAVGNGRYRIYADGGSAGVLQSMAASLGNNVTANEVTADSNYRMRLTWSGNVMIIDAVDDMLYPQFKAATPNAEGVYVVDLGERAYRGMIEIGRYEKSSTLTAISVVGIEDYLYGVIACEMVPSWEMEALKAQAICARSYAYAIDKRNVTFNAENGYALYDTTRSQVYKGYNYEYPRTNEAVDATKGLMIYFRENVVKAYFYSTSGGHTANCEDVWDVPLTYFRGVADNTEFHQEKRPWIVSMTKSQIASSVGNVGGVLNVTPQIRTTSGRIYQLKVTGTAGSATLKKEQISSTFSLPSTKVKVIKYGDVPDEVYVKTTNENVKKRISSSYVISGDGNVAQVSDNLEQYIVISDDNMTNFPKNAPSDSETIFFAGMGYGHGVGLSQSGAQSMALLGYNYNEIINHYYNKVDIR